MPALILLASLFAFAPPLTPEAISRVAFDPFEGLYACIDDDDHYVYWVGLQNDLKWYQRLQLMIIEEGRYPIETTLRYSGSGRYTVRDGAFDTMESATEFEERGGDLVLVYNDEPCTRVATFREALTQLGLDPEPLAQEVIDIYGLSRADVETRLNDPAFAYAAFGYDDDTNGLERDLPLSDVLYGRTLPEPPPPPTDVPANAPQGSDAFAGIYVNDSSTARLFLIRDGRYLMFTREWAQTNPVYEYAYELEDAYDYSVRDGAFTYKYSDTTFERDGVRVVALEYRDKTSKRVYTLRQLIEANEWEVKPMVDYLTSERGLSEVAANDLLDDATHLDRVVREGSDGWTFADLANAPE